MCLRKTFAVIFLSILLLLLLLLLLSGPSRSIGTHTHTHTSTSLCTNKRKTKHSINTKKQRNKKNSKITTAKKNLPKVPFIFFSAFEEDAKLSRKVADDKDSIFRMACCDREDSIALLRIVSSFFLLPFFHISLLLLYCYILYYLYMITITFEVFNLHHSAYTFYLGTCLFCCYIRFLFCFCISLVFCLFVCYST